MSFLLPSEGEFIRENLESMDPLGMAIHLLPFENAYLPGFLQREIESAVRGRISSNIFSSSFASVLEELDKIIPEISPNAADRLFLIYQDFFNCSSRIVLNLRWKC